MRKPRAFASLTEAEIDQIAEWLLLETYETVLERVRKPRPDGFGLLISRSPFERLWASKNKIDRINKLLSEGKKLTVSGFESINAGEKPDVADEVHDAILTATYDLVTSGDNTPTQLLALQRLADFPARAEFRAQRLEGEAQMRAHKIEMDAHRRKISEERLELSKRLLNLREKQLTARTDLNHSAFPTGRSGSDPQCEMSDHLGPYAATLDEIQERARRKFGLPLRLKPSPNTRPPEALGNNPEDSCSASLLSPVQSGSSGSSVVKDSVPSFPPVQPSVVDPSSASFAISAVNYSGSSFSPFPSVQPSVVENSEPSLFPSSVRNHAIRRWRSYLPRRYLDPLPDETWIEECPCGAKLPCDLHGHLWVEVRYLKPSHPDYAAALTRHGIPVYVPRPEEKDAPRTLKEKRRRHDLSTTPF